MRIVSGIPMLRVGGLKMFELVMERDGVHRTLDERIWCVGEGDAGFDGEEVV